MDPYRERPRRKRVVAGRRTALVDDLVRQFASPHAFARELVQNALDAGATRIDVVLRHEPERSTVTFSDDGSGMGPETARDRLLVLFSSSKAGDRTTIGRYGIGFASVFALEPERVWVHTSDGKQQTDVEIRPDHSYDLTSRANGGPSGTSVVLWFSWTVEQFVEHERKLRAALAHWCRHVASRLEIAVRRGNDEQRYRADEPISVPGIAPIVRRIDGDSYALALARGPRALAGFYNRGLLLAQVDGHAFLGLSGVNFKVSSPALGHTLSRDDVRRDQAFGRILSEVRRLADEDLMDALAEAIDSEVERLVAVLGSGRTAPSAERYRELLGHALALEARFVRGRIHVPLVRPWRGAGSVPLANLVCRVGHVTCARVNNELARNVEIDEPILYAPKGVAARLGELLPGIALHWLHERFVRRVDVQPADADQRALLDELGKCLTAAGSPVEAVRFARFDGRRLGAFALALPAERAVSERADVKTWARCIDADDTLFLDVEHDVTLVALQKARGENVRRVAGMLARLLLLEHAGAPAPRVSDGLLGYLITEES